MKKENSVVQIVRKGIGKQNYLYWIILQSILRIWSLGQFGPASLWLLTASKRSIQAATSSAQHWNTVRACLPNLAYSKKVSGKNWRFPMKQSLAVFLGNWISLVWGLLDFAVMHLCSYVHRCLNESKPEEECCCFDVHLWAHPVHSALPWRMSGSSSPQLCNPDLLEVASECTWGYHIITA